MLPRDQNSAKLVETLVLSYAHGRWVNTPVERKPLLSLRGASFCSEAGSPSLKAEEDVTVVLSKKNTLDNLTF
jgi:hypothetical protein